MFPQQRKRVDQEAKRGSIMGDKSPKSVRRQATQKQVKSNAVDQKKQQATAAKQAVFKKS
jgi:hypothetical protein